ncbi:MAG: riboflavin kinase [Christensenellales bacterium]
MEKKHKKPLCSLSGLVVHGKGNGKTVGMPTANLQIDPKTPLPPLGVYASMVQLSTGCHLGVTNIGYRPSVDQDRRISIETFILDFDADLYGQTISVDLYDFLRPTVKFSSLQEVQRQVSHDCEQVRLLLGPKA